MTQDGPMNLESLLPRLDQVKSSGPDKYTARCPAHDDRHPSLAIVSKEGKVLLKCWAGCSSEDIIAAL